MPSEEDRTPKTLALSCPSVCPSPTASREDMGQVTPFEIGDTGCPWQGKKISFIYFALLCHHLSETQCGILEFWCQKPLQTLFYSKNKEAEAQGSPEMCLGDIVQTKCHIF